MSKNTRKFLLSIFFLNLVNYSVAHCAITDPMNLGGKSLAMGGAVVAVADDLMSALYTNPAGLLQLEGEDMMAGSVFVFNRPRYKSTDGYKKENCYDGIVPFAGYSNRLSDNVALGIGIFSTLGNGFKFEDYDAGGVTGDLKNVGGVLSLAPTVSYMIYPELYLGLQVQIGYAISEMDMPTPLGYLKADSDGFGATPAIGLLYKPTSCLNLGLKWKGPMKTSLEGDADLFQPNGQKMHDSVDTDLYWPQMFELGMAYKLRHDLLVSVYGKWTDWSYFEKSEMKYKNLTVFSSKVIPDMRDGIRYGVGAEYKPRPSLSLRCGYMYDQYSVDSKYLSPFMVDLSSDMVTFGGEITFGNIKLEIFSAYVSYKPRKGTGAFPGEYSGDGSLVGLEISYHF